MSNPSKRRFDQEARASFKIRSPPSCHGEGMIAQQTTDLKIFFSE